MKLSFRKFHFGFALRQLRFTKGVEKLLFCLLHVYLIYILTLFGSEVYFLFLTKASAAVSYCEICTESC